MERKEEFVCCLCQKTYNLLKNLRKHARQKHPDELNVVVPSKNKKYECSACGKKYNSKKSFNLHERKIHNIEYIKVGAFYECPLCSFIHYEKTNMLQHFTCVHQILLEEEQLQFTSLDKFTSWKNSFEQKTCSKFILKGGLQKKRHTKFVYYQCHRNGHFQSTSKGLRQLKTQGSKKIEGFCPAQISVTVKSDNVKVRLSKTHVGHENDRIHLTSNKQNDTDLDNEESSIDDGECGDEEQLQMDTEDLEMEVTNVKPEQKDTETEDLVIEIFKNKLSTLNREELKIEVENVKVDYLNLLNSISNDDQLRIVKYYFKSIKSSMEAVALSKD